MVCGNIPFEQDEQIVSAQVRVRGPRPISRQCEDLIQHLLEYRPADRPSLEQILLHPWLSADAEETPVAASAAAASAVSSMECAMEATPEAVTSGIAVPSPRRASFSLGAWLPSSPSSTVSSSSSRNSMTEVDLLDDCEFAMEAVIYHEEREHLPLHMTASELCWNVAAEQPREIERRRLAWHCSPSCRLLPATPGPPDQPLIHLRYRQVLDQRSFFSSHSLQPLLLIVHPCLPCFSKISPVDARRSQPWHPHKPDSRVLTKFLIKRWYVKTNNCQDQVNQVGKECKPNFSGYQCSTRGTDEDDTGKT